MTTAKEMQNAAREEAVFLTFFTSYPELIDNEANESLLRRYCDENYLPIDDSSLEAAADELWDSLAQKPKPPAQRSAESLPEVEPEPEAEKVYLGQGSMSAEQLARVRRGMGAFAPLGPEITREMIRRSDGKTLRGWMEKYGNEQLTTRLNEPTPIEENQ